MSNERRYWFPAKRYGWGWGLPATWQGWAVYIVFVALLSAGAVVFPPTTNWLGFILGVILLSSALIAICWTKGEPPRWRWGND